jgi:serine/threonine protein kinase
MELVLGARLGRYEIRSQLGAGGMGEVYLAEDIRLHRKVALKILPAEVASNQDRMRRFNQEAQAAAALNHPHIAHIYEIGEHDGTHFIAMEFVDGLTLREKIHVSSYQIAAIYAGLRQKDQAFAWLEKAHEERSDGLVNLKAEQRFDSLRSDSRFADLMRRVGLPP